ncbi:hypothetical protein DXG01_002555 [Tephrocybe rancida]|nr:hypothetical protein DXG01_002555 [Tephrocybe rancida]
MPPRIPPNTKLEQEWLLNEDHERQERERDQARLDALLAQQVSAPSSVPLVSTSPSHDIVHVAPIVEAPSRSPLLPPVSSKSPSGHPALESSLDEDGNPELDELEDEGETGGESGEVGSDPEEWGGISTDDLGSNPAHLEFVSDKLFFEVMRALHSEDPPAAWCASVRCARCIAHDEVCMFAKPEGKHQRIPCVPRRRRGVKCPICNIWLAERGKQEMGWPRLWVAERLLNVRHLEVAGPHVPVSDLLTVWRHAATGTPLPESLSALFARLLVPAGSSKRKRSPSPELPDKQRQESEPRVVKECVAVQRVGTSHLCAACKQKMCAPQLRPASQTGIDSEEMGVEMTGLCRLLDLSSPSPSPPPNVPQIRPGTPLFLPASDIFSPLGVLWSPLPAASIPQPVPVMVTAVSPDDNLLIDLASDVEVPAAAPPPRVFSLLQPQHVHPSPCCYFVKPSEDGEVVDGLEEGLSAMTPSKILGLMQRELESLTPKQLRNLLLRIKGQHQTEFEAFEEMARGWRESLAYAQGLAIGEHQCGLLIINDRYTLQTRLGMVRGELAAGLRSLSSGRPEARRSFEVAAQRLEEAVAIDMASESWLNTWENAQLFKGGAQLPSVKEVRRHFFDNPRAMSPRSRQEVRRQGGEQLSEGTQWEDYEDLEGLYGPDPEDLEGQKDWGGAEDSSRGSYSGRKWKEGEAGPSNW